MSALKPDQVVGLQPFRGKPADRQQRAVHRERRNDGVDARAVGQARVDHRRAVVDAAADAADDAVDDAQQVLVVLERRGHPLEDAPSLDEHVLVGVDQDVVDRRVAEQRLERPEAEDVIEDFGEQGFALAQVDRRRLLGEQLAEERANLTLGARAIRLRQRFEVQPVEQLAVHVRAQLEVLRTRALGPRCRGNDRFRSHGRCGSGSWTSLPDRSET